MTKLVLPLALSTCLLGACTGRDSAPRATPDVPRSSSSVIVTPRVSLKPLMQKLLRLTDELRRRAGAVGLTGPARLLAAAVVELPEQGQPDAFRKWRGELEQRARQLTTRPPDVRAGYNAVVEACLGCHRQYEKRSVPQLEALRLPPR